MVVPGWTIVVVSRTVVGDGGAVAGAMVGWTVLRVRDVDVGAYEKVTVIVAGVRVVG